METKKRGKFMGTKEKLSGLLLAVCMAFILAPITVRADVTTEKWTDFAAADFAGGSGTKEEPYQIATPEQLAKLAADVNSGVPGQIHSGEYFKLTAPIDLSGKRWIPIGYGNASSKSFSGYFDGNNQVIMGLYVDERGNNVCAGLFGVVVAISDETVLKNISIENAEIYAGYGTDANASPDIYGAGGRSHNNGRLWRYLYWCGELSWNRTGGFQNVCRRADWFGKPCPCFELLGGCYCDRKKHQRRVHRKYVSGTL